jgi:hypothetical protein
MTEAEVGLIYEYLHENYEYCDGELVRSANPKAGSRIRQGHSLGSFFYQGNQNPRLRCTLNIDGTDYTHNLAALIYLYHNKFIPQVIDYIDENPTNCKIENLKESSRTLVEYKKNVRGWKPVVLKNGTTRYRITLQIKDGSKIHFGSCETKEEARAVYDLAKKIYIEDQLASLEIKKRVMKEFPHLKMRLQKENICGFEGVYKRGAKFVARYIHNKKSNTSTHDTAEEAHKNYLIMKEGDFKRTNRLRISDICSIEDCGKDYFAKGLCSAHYTKEIRKNNPRRIRPNKTGFAGVKADKGRFYARHNGKHLGSFNTPEEAHAAYLKAKEEYK